VARLALAESDPAKAMALHLLALEQFDKAEKAGAVQIAAGFSAMKDLGT
jgi:hypothetical protein